MQLVDDNNKIHPIFCNCFAGRQMFADAPNEFIRTINNYYAKIDGEEFLPFESELELLYNLIKEFNPEEPVLKNNFTLFKCLINFYLGKEELSKEFYDQIVPENFDPDENFDSIYAIIGKVYLNKTNKSIPNSKIVISGSFDHHLLHFQRHYLKKLHYPNMQLESSQNLPEISQIFEECKHIFFVGHGNDVKNEGLNYYYDYTKAFRLRAETLRAFSNETQVLGLLSCASEPYASIRGIAKYFIIPETGFSEYAEMFIKGFYRKWEEFGDIELNIQLGLIALLLRSNKELVFNVYRDGEPFKI